jgi:hypothetical protein
MNKSNSSFPANKRLPAAPANSASANAKTIVGVGVQWQQLLSDQGTLVVGLTVKQTRHDGPLLHLDTKSTVRCCELESTTYKLRKLQGKDALGQMVCAVQRKHPLLQLRFHSPLTPIPG